MANLALGYTTSFFQLRGKLGAVTYCDSRPLARWATAFLVAALLIAIRRWPQIADPAVWVEDGVLVVPGLLEHGWRFIFEPLNGYLILPSKLTSWLALKLSFTHYAFVSTILSTLVAALCVSLIAVCPSILPARLALAFATVLVPIYPEPFGLPLYVFWWTSLLLFVALFWRGDGVFGRATCVVVGGVSSPLVIVLTPLFVLRLSFDRSFGALVAALLSILVSALQAYFVFTTANSQTNRDFSIEALGLGIEKFFGFFAFLDSAMALPAGLLLIALLLFGLRFVEGRFAYLLLGLCLMATIVASLGRMEVAAFHPVRAGPRYFFYPYIIIFWMLIYLVVRGRSWIKLASVIFLGLAILDLKPRFVRQQQAIMAWPDQVRQCLSQPSTTFVIKTNDKARHVWTHDFSRSLCAAGQRGAVLR